MTLVIDTISFLLKLFTEFWKQIPLSEPYRVILGDVRDKLYNTREHAHKLLANGSSDVPEESTFTHIDQVTYSIMLYPIYMFLFIISI